jgi:hypothetical protein
VKQMQQDNYKNNKKLELIINFYKNIKNI